MRTVIAVGRAGTNTVTWNETSNTTGSAGDERHLRVAGLKVADVAGSSPPCDMNVLVAVARLVATCVRERQG